MSLTWNQIISLSFEDLGVIQPGETLTATLLANGQSRLNTLLGQLNTEGATVFQQVMQSFNLTASFDSYTLGVGGSMNTAARAQKVTAWRAYYSTLMSRGGRVLSMEEFGIAAKQAAGDLASIPELVAADTAYPLINVRIHPRPSSLPGVLELAYWTPITAISDFTATPTLPDGWEEMIHFNLAVSLAPQYARQGGIPPELAAAAQNSKASLVNQNAMGAPAQVAQ